MSLSIFKKFSNLNICHFGGWKTEIQHRVEHLFFSIWGDFNSLEFSAIILGHFCDLSLCICIFLGPLLKPWLESRLYLKYILKLNWKYIITALIFIHILFFINCITQPRGTWTNLSFWSFCFSLPFRASKQNLFLGIFIFCIKYGK